MRHMLHNFYKKLHKSHICPQAFEEVAIYLLAVETC